MSIKITIDDRERKIIPFFADIDEAETADISYVVQRIYTGDYSITRGDHILAVIERKSWADLLQSMTDGRKDNVENLIEFQSKYDCRAFYIIEGTPPKIQRRRLQSHLDHIMFRDHIHIVYTRGPQQTAARLYELARNISTLKLENSGADAINEQRKKTPEQITRQMWLTIPGIGPSVVDEISKTCTLRAFLTDAAAPDLTSVTFPGGRKVNIDKIIGARSSVAAHKKILTCIPGLTAALADVLLAAHSIRELIETPECIDNIKYNNRKVGKNIIQGMSVYF